MSRLQRLTPDALKKDICILSVEVNLKKSLYLSVIWLMPVLLILLEAAIFLGKLNWSSDYLPYFITFWSVRAFLAPLIAWYTLRWWTEINKVGKLLLIHIAGFLLFSLLFWSIAWLILHERIGDSLFFGLSKTSTNMHVFGMIVDNSISTNCIVYASTVGFCYVREFFRRNVSINKRAMELEKSLLTSRLELLKGQLNTHFLFNTLHTISSLVARRQNEEANQMLVSLSELLRFALKENKDQLIPLYKELELLQLYIDIQETRFRDRLNVTVNVEPGLNHQLIPSLLLQPLVENAVKYGIEPYSEAGEIDVAIRSLDHYLMISVSDSGKGNFSSIDFSNGIGLTNTKERLKQLYRNNYKLYVQPSYNGKGVKVMIELPKSQVYEFETADSR